MMERKRMLETLEHLRLYALEKHARMELVMHHEDSHFLRLANSGVSLNTFESLTRLDVTAYGTKNKASAGVMGDIGDQKALETCVDKALEMLSFAGGLSYEPTLEAIKSDVDTSGGYDADLAELKSEDVLDYVNLSALGLESEDAKLSGNFSHGGTLVCFMNTLSPHHVSWEASDAQVTLVLSSLKNKWELNAEQSAATVKELDPYSINSRLKLLKGLYTSRPASKVPPGAYRVVFGPAATAEYLDFLTFLGLSGEMYKRGYSFNRESDVGKIRLSRMVTLLENPGAKDCFPMPWDAFGRMRPKRTCYDNGVFTGFLWSQSAADEFGAEPSFTDVPHLSFVLQGGTDSTGSLEELIDQPRDRDILYVPYLHYTGLVNPTEGLVTGTSRFGALWLKKDGSIAIPYNVRFTEKVEDLLGKKLLWMSRKTVPYNTSQSYDRRDPQAVVVPALMCCDDIQVELSNDSF